MSTAGQIVGGVVGTVVGAFVGYPMLGAQIGLMIGGYLDPPKQKINRPTTDLSVQTATYGTPVGTGYGNYATFGNVFWVKGNKLDLVEGDDGGKGGGDEPTPDKVYGTFAIGFGEGEIAGFGRIWCNGKLVSDPTSSDTGAMLETAAVNALMTSITTPKGQGGVPGNSGGGMRFYLGTADQLPDPSIQADMGAAYAPGYRGLRYIVFVNWDLTDYGNTLMGLQVKAEILNSATVDQFDQLSYVDEVLRSTTSFPGALGYEFGYYNPRIENGLFWVEKHSDANNYTYYAGISHEGVLVSGGLTTGVAGDVPATGTFGYIGRAAAGDVVYDVQSATGNFRVSGSVFKVKTSDPDNTCHGMAVGVDGRIYALETVAAAWQFNIYDGTTLALISSGVNNVLHIGNSNLSVPLIPGTNMTFAVESDGVHLWAATESGGDQSFLSCSIDGDGNLNLDHEFNEVTESHLGAYAKYAAIYADGGLCCGVNDHGDFFSYSRVEILGPTNVPLADIIEARCLLSGLLTAGDLDLGDITQTVRGYRVHEVTSIRASLEPLQGAFPFDIIPSGYQIAFKPRGASPVATIDIGECGCVAGNEKIGDILTQSREMDSQLPVKVQVTYFDVNREYDKGTGPGAMRLNTDAVNIQNIDMPIVLDANEAAGIEEVLLYMYWMERTEFKFVLPPTRRNLEPADVITLTAPGASYELRLTEINDLPDGRMECSARPNNPAIYTPTAQGQEGQSTGQVLSFAGATFTRLLDIPCVDDTYQNTPGFVVAMDGYASGWTGATLYVSPDNGTTWSALDTLTAPGSMLGELVTAPAAGRTDIVDQKNTITARFYSAANLATLTWDEFYAEGNYFAVGGNGRWEIIGAKTVVENADGTWTLSDLLRGRYGTDANIGSHVAGDVIALLDPTRLEFINMSTSAIGLSRLYTGVTLRQTLNASMAEAFAYAGENLECRSPVYLNGSRHPSTLDWTLVWIRRTRLPVEPFSGVAAPLGESSESYEVEIWNSTYTTLKRTITGITSQTTTYTSAQQTADFGGDQVTLYVKVYQLSATVGRGWPLTASISRAMVLDPWISYVVSGLHFNGTNGSPTITDSFGTNGTAAGNAQITTSDYAALTSNTSSLLLDGTTDWVTLPHATRFDFGSGDFTIEGWYKTTTNDINLWSKRLGVTWAPVSIVATTGIIAVRASTSGAAWAANFNANGSSNDGAWHHVAVVRYGTALYLFVDGVKQTATGTVTGALMTNTSDVHMGGNSDGSGCMNGKMDDWRVTKGYARYTATFTPPSRQFPDS